MLKPFAIVVAVATTLCCTALGTPPEPPRVSDADVQQITPVIYAYISSHHMPDTIVSFTHGDRGVVEVRTHEDNLFILRKTGDGWKIIRVGKYDVDRDVVR